MIVNGFYRPDRRRWIGDRLVADSVYLPALKARYFVNFPIVDEARFALADALEAWAENRDDAFYDERIDPVRLRRFVCHCHGLAGVAHQHFDLDREDFVQVEPLAARSMVIPIAEGF